MLIKVNGQEVELPEGSTIQDAIQKTQAPFEAGSVLGLIKGKEDVERYVNKYRLKTTKGSIIIEILSTAPQELINTWKSHYHLFKNLRIRWTTANEVAVGPIVTELQPTHEENDYDRWEVILSLSGFTAEATHIIFSKSKHSAVYGVPPFNRGVFARVVGGKRTIMKLTDEDHIQEVKPVVERKSIVKSAAITNLETELSAGNEVFTHILVKTTDKSPQSAEHFFALAEKGKMRVDYESNSFLGFYNLQGLEVPSEHIAQRRRGTITLRNTGKGIGRVYIYREDRVSTPSHNLVGTVDLGMELLDMADEGDMVTVLTDPQRIMTLSMTQEEAGELLSQQGIEQVREGAVDDQDIIVEQNPHFTMDILQEGKVQTWGVPREQLIHIELNDKSPRSNWYFKKITGLLNSPVGSLKVHFAFPGMKVMMFRGSPGDAKGLIPENNPKNCVKSGEIGITNMSRRHVGMIGVRFENNDEFGPTGEPFAGTNIIGRITQGLENLEKYNEGDIVYVTEKKF